MVKVVEDFDFTVQTSIKTLKPGQIGKVGKNGTFGGFFVMGVHHSKRHSMSPPHDATIFAVVLATGELVSNESMMVIAYPEHIELHVRPSQNMGTQ